jgi:hypothetical protein
MPVIPAVGRLKPEDLQGQPGLLERLCLKQQQQKEAVVIMFVGTLYVIF